jgi:hypothetical protein
MAKHAQRSFEGGPRGLVALLVTSLAAACSGQLQESDLASSDEQLALLAVDLEGLAQVSKHCAAYSGLCKRAAGLCGAAPRRPQSCGDLLARCQANLAEFCGAASGAASPDRSPDAGAPRDLGTLVRYPRSAAAGDSRTPLPVPPPARDSGSPVPAPSKPVDGGSDPGGPPSSPPSLWPSASNTGWQPTGVRLTPSGTLTIRTNGSVVEGKDISGEVLIQASNVTLRRCRVRSSSWYPIRVMSGSGIVIEDTEVDGLGGPSDGGQKCLLIQDGNVLVQRNNLHDCEDGMSLNGDAGITVRDNYVHTPRGPASLHSDGMELYGGSNMVIQHNRFDYFHATTAATNLTNEWAPISNITFDHNWLAGGAYILYLDGSHGGGTISQIRVTNNRFVRGSSAYGVLVARGTLSAITWSGNVFDDNEEPISYDGPGGR